MARRLVRVAVTAVSICWLQSGIVAAQSTGNGSIGGVVRDTSGAIMPGVTVEVASPALIEKVRAAATDGDGNYRIVDLRPGQYSVTFTLPGFATIRREGIEVSTGFAATVNAEMTVGSVEETITVVSAAPTVDVQNSRTQRVLKAEVLDALPTGTKNFYQIGAMILGASTGTTNDVGGDKGERAGGIVLHGSRANDGRAFWDGMNTNYASGQGGGGNRIYAFNTVGVQEIVVDAGGNSAESETGGATVNMVPKDGGNTFRLYGVANYTNKDLSSSNVSDELVARGVGPQASLKEVYEYGVGVGGAIRQDRLWFYTAHRWWGSANYAANNYFDKSTNPYAYEPDLSRPAYTETFYADNGIRLTWQPARNHKINQEEHLQHGCQCWLVIGLGVPVSPDAATSWTYGPNILSQTTWSYVATNKLLIQAGASFLRQRVAADPGNAVPNKFTGRTEVTWPGPQDIPITELSTGYTWGALPGSNLNYSRPRLNANAYAQRFAVSYITGSHAFRTGFQATEGPYNNFGMAVPNQLNYQFRNGVPASLTQWAGPFAQYMQLSSVALYAQDQWTVKRLTLNLGVRFDRFEGHTLAGTAPAGTFIPAREVPEYRNLPNYKDFTPRLGAAYDVFGNGRTAVKGSYGRYLAGQGGGPSLQFGPAYAIVQSAGRTWNDANGNFAPDCVLTDLQSNGECGTINNLAFGQPITNITMAEDARKGWNARPYNHQLSVQLQHELLPTLSLAVGYHRTWWRNQLVLQNTATAATDYTQYCVTAPSDARLGPTGGQQLCGYYDVNPNKFGQVNRVITLAKNFGQPEESYNGVEFGFNARWTDGRFLQGGLSVGRQTFDYCYANDRPELTPEGFPNTTLFPQFTVTSNYPRSADTCRVRSSWWNGVGSQVKLQGAYPLPWWGVILSGTFKHLPGIAQTANLVLGNAQIAPALGRNLSACPAAGTCTATVTHALIPFGTSDGVTQGTVFDQRLNETDVRIAKSLTMGRSRLQAMVDIYNIFDSRPPQGILNTYGAVWLRPTLLLGGRLFKVGAQVDF